ncbi:MAG: NAD(P)-dependent oxidoreductase [Actinomycetota bacterium]|nr:NAD(P)-dependent oxidoreductase [Actinomycetota bacterium]
MRIFVAGATGALGKQLVPQLVAAGHQVTGMTRSAQKAELLREMGAEPVVADALDAEAVGAAVAGAEPDVVINQLTAISDDPDFRKPDKEFAQTNRLRTEGTDILLSTAVAAGAKRYIAQSFAGWPFELDGPRVKDEEAPLQTDPPKGVVEMLAAIRHLESAVTGAEGIEGVVLRYGGFYGPNTSLAANPDGSMTKTIRKRKMPIVGKGTGVWSFIQIADAASATVAAVEHGEPGIYNVVDDEPAPVSEWLPVLAETLGAKRPMRVPALIGRIVAGPAAVVMMNDIRGAANAKAKRELGWQPEFTSWRDGFARGLA